MELAQSKNRSICMRFFCSFLLVLTAFSQNVSTFKRLDGSNISLIEAQKTADQILREARVAGAQITLVQHGKTVWNYAYGVRKLDPALKMTTDTKTWAASITKSVFATYVMMLVERKEFSLDEPVYKQLPQPLNTYEPYRETASALIQEPDWKLVTPRILLAHTSGLANFSFFEPDKKMHLQFKPGTQYRYSGDGINLVQFLIEQKKGNSLDILMERDIFKPLGMSDTSLIFQKKFAENIADRFGTEGQFLSETKRFPARGAGSMTTSAQDLGHFTEGLFSGKLINQQTLAQMFKPFIQIRTLHQFAFEENEPPGTEAKKAGLAYGMGWGLLTKTRFGPAFFKEGHGDGAQNYMICFSKNQTCMIILTNSDNGELAFRSLLEKIMGNTVTPWEWEGYTPSRIEARQKAEAAQKN